MCDELWAASAANDLVEVSRLAYAIAGMGRGPRRRNYRTLVENRSCEEWRGILTRPGSEGGLLGAGVAGDGPAGDPKHKHLHRVAAWFYALLMKRAPWQSWTSDIYDAMRCIDHLPIG